MMLGGQITTFDQLGIVQQRVGNRSVNNAPRNVYRTGDGQWVAVSTSSQSIAERVMRLVGRPDLIDEPWFATGHQRAQHADELDDAVGSWIAARPAAEVIAAFEEAQAAIGPVYDVRGVMADPQYAAIGTMPPSTTTSSDRSRCRTCCSGCPSRPGRSAGPAARTVPTPTRCSASSATDPNRRARASAAARRGNACEPDRSRPPIVTALYVPGDRPDRFEKAAASGTQLVILDLEDAVAPDRKYGRPRRRGRLAAVRRRQADVRSTSGSTPGRRRPRGPRRARPRRRRTSPEGRVARRHRAASPSSSAGARSTPSSRPPAGSRRCSTSPPTRP